jgi:hypothetical protein
MYRTVSYVCFLQRYVFRHGLPSSTRRLIQPVTVAGHNRSAVRMLSESEVQEDTLDGGDGNERGGDRTGEGLSGDGRGGVGEGRTGDGEGQSGDSKGRSGDGQRQSWDSKGRSGDGEGEYRDSKG